MKTDQKIMRNLTISSKNASCRDFWNILVQFFIINKVPSFLLKIFCS